MVLLSCVAGYARGLVYSLQSVGLEGWAVTASYLIAMPLLELLRISPGLICGYLFRGKYIYLVALISFLAYPAFQGLARMEFNLDAQTSAAQGLAFAIVTSVAALAGAWLKERPSASKKPAHPSADAPAD